MASSKVLMEFECTKYCHSRNHGSQLVSATTKRAVTDAALASFFKSTCHAYLYNVDYEGRSLLHMAASRGRRSLVEWLARRYPRNPQGVSHLDLRDLESGYTALHRSVYYGQIHTSVALMKIGASTTIFDYDDYCPVDHAMLDRPPRCELSKQMPCEVYAWGSNTNYTSGTGSQHQRNFPELLTTFTKQNIFIKQVCLSKFHSVFVSTSGGVWACGHGEGGRLGVARGDTCVLPTSLVLPERCTEVAVGRDHTLFLMQSGAIYSCGLNAHHQLGQVPPPASQLSPRPVKVKVTGARGIRAGRYHSAAFNDKGLYTWGLNGGQLGHPKADGSTILIPKKVAKLGNGQDEYVIEHVAVSDGATVVSTSRGDVYLLHQFQCRRLASRIRNMKKVEVIGGEVVGGDKLTDYQKQLSVLVLTTCGNIHLWQDKTNQLMRCIFSMNRPVVVMETALTRDSIMITSKDGEAFHGVVMPKKIRINKTPVVSPDQSSFSTKTNSNNQTKNELHKFIDKDDCIVIKLKRLPNIHRAVDICGDRKGNNFAVLQVSPNCGLLELPQVTSSQMTANLSALLEEASEYDLLHDVVLKVDNQLYPAHRFIISSGSEYFAKLCYPQSSEIISDVGATSDKLTIPVNNIHPLIFKQLLKYLYTGECDLSTLGPCNIKIKIETNNDKNELNKKMANGNIDLVMDAQENLGELSAFEVNQKKIKSTKKENSKKEKERLNKAEAGKDKEFYDPVRLLQEAAKRLSVTGLYKMLDKYACHNGQIILKDSKNKYKESKYCLNRLEHTELWDTNIKCADGTIIKAHKCILAARLDYFNGMFAHSWTESTANSTISMPISYNMLSAIIVFLYTDECPELKESDDFEFLCNMLVLSDQLFISRLREMCEVAFANMLTLKNVTEIFQLACTYNCPQLKNCCMEYISLNLASILDSKSLETLSPELLEELTKFHCSFNPVMSNRVITPFSDATSDEIIMSCSDSFPVNLDAEFDEEILDDSKKSSSSGSGKKKSRPRRISFTENEKCRRRNESVSSITSLDLSPEKNEDVTLSLSKISDQKEGWVKVLNTQQKQQKVIQARLKAINIVKENANILDDAPESFTKLVKQDKFSYDRSLSASSPLSQSPVSKCNGSYPTLSSPISVWDAGNMSPQDSFNDGVGRSPQTTLNITVVNTKMSQKQRKKMALENKDPLNLAEQLDKLNMKKGVNFEPEPVVSPQAKNPWQKIDTAPIPMKEKNKSFCDILEDERKQKENLCKMMTKPLALTQLEDKAIEELSRFYNASSAEDEVITVKRVPCYQIAAPKWIDKGLKTTFK